MRTLKLNNGISMPVLGLGTFMMKPNFCSTGFKVSCCFCKSL